MELFAERGFDGVTVKDITRSLDLTEATLYIHFKSKAALLQAIFAQLEEQLVTPAFTAPTRDLEDISSAADLARFLVTGARRFFSRATKETQLIWRLLMISQYRYEAAHEGVRDQLIEAPAAYFASMINQMKRKGIIDKGVDTRAAGRTIAAVFFQYSFTANLNAAWDPPRPSEPRTDHLADLRKQLEVVARGLMRG